MKRIFIYFYILFAAVSLRAADGDLFPYPVPPADMERLDERCDYIITRFWQQCDFKSAMSKSDKLRSTFADWISMMPYANADSVHKAIDKVILTVSKSAPQTLMLAQMAEAFTYSDSADIRSAEIFLPFAKAAANHKKIDAQNREYYSKIVQRLENVRNGKPVQHLEFITPDKRKGSLKDYHTQMIAIIFNSHDNFDSSLARIRLSVEPNVKHLLERGLLTIISIEPGEASPEWVKETESYPQNWVIGAAPDAADWFEITSEPTIFLLDGRHKVLASKISTDGLINVLTNLRQQSGM